MMPTVEDQMKALRRGAADIVPEEELLEKLKNSRKEDKPLRVKLGLDPTAPDIHIGNAVPLHMLRRLQDLGHHAVLIIGDYTATIGDPSQQNSMRPQLSHDEVMEHARTYLEQVGKIVDLDEAEILQNGSWFSEMNLANVIQLAGKLTVARCLERDDFKKRLNEGRAIGVHEMLYPLMQAYDSVKVKSDIEIGGTDQIFNILLGRDLQRETGMEPQVAITNPLLEGLDGTKKMSKSIGNYIGINESPDTIYGKAMSIPDKLMEKYFLLATDVPQAKIEALLSGDTHPRQAKAALAHAIVRRYHSREEADKAAEEFDRVFQEKKLPSDIPQVSIEKGELKDGTIWIVKLVQKTPRASSNGEARRLIKQGGVRVGPEMDKLKAIEDPNTDLEIDGTMLLNIGKRHFWQVEVT